MWLLTHHGKSLSGSIQSFRVDKATGALGAAAEPDSEGDFDKEAE
jgi:hypothetical protein